jgi:hypothetical protein
MVFETVTAVLIICGWTGVGECGGLVVWGIGVSLGNSSKVPSIVMQAGVHAGVNSSCMGVRIVAACAGWRWWH